jgi:cytoskeletal protein RodZ
MEEIGRTLRETRERLGLTLEEVERSTHIRVERLTALENDDFDSLASQAQARGFLGNYADFLGLDREDILEQFAQSRGRRTSQLIKIGSKTEPSASRPFVRVRKPRLFSSDLLVAGLIIIGVTAMLIWGGGRVFAALNSEPDLTQVDQLSQTTQLNETPTENPPTAMVLSGLINLSPEAATPTSTLQLGVVETTSIVVIAEQQAWIRITVDGEEAFSGRVRRDEALEYYDFETLELLTGNGGVIRVLYNNQDIGFLGEIGQVIIRIWTAEGLVTPTPTITRTPAPPTATQKNTPAPNSVPGG